MQDENNGAAVHHDLVAQEDKLLLGSIHVCL